MTSLPLTPIADVQYNLPVQSAPRTGFDLGLILGTSNVISTGTRVVVYNSLEEMIDAGFTDESPEYVAAALYFASPGQPSQVAIGRQGSGETPVQAITACRNANGNWYTATVLDATDEEHLDVAEYIEALQTYSTYFITSDEADIISNADDNLFQLLKEAGYRRTLGMYSTTDYAVTSIEGYAMGATTDANNSGYTLMFKTMPGVTAQNLTQQQVNNVYENNGNLYLERGSYYTFFQKGTMADGTFFDEVIYLDKLANEIQLSVVDLLVQNPKIPQTEAGMARLRTVISSACQKLVNIGFIAPGVWTGGNILTLKTGDTLPVGYLVMSESIASQSQADREARKSPPIYVAIKLAGAIQSVFIEIDVNR